MNKGWIVAIVLFIIIVLGVLALVFVPSSNVAQAPNNSGTASSTPNTAPDNSSALSDSIVVTSPTSGGTVTSPLNITGKARGTWYFEASAPVALLDANGSVIAQGTIAAQGDWMTTDFVPFTASLTYPPQPAGSVGTLVLTNDNPSGDPTKQLTLDIPIQF